MIFGKNIMESLKTKMKDVLLMSDEDKQINQNVVELKDYMLKKKGRF